MSSASFRVLSLDGGGIRGAFGAAFLAELERRLGRPVAACFDLLAGTSTGGVIATALALGEPAARIESFYLERGPEIFTRPKVSTPLWARIVAQALRQHLGGVDADWLCACKYGSEALRRALTEVFGTRTLESARRRLVVPAVDLARGQTVVFKTPHLPGLERDREFRAVDVILATTAAPTYFSHAVIGPGSAYCDGGLWANNPAVVAYAEACRIATLCKRPGIDPVFGPADVSMLSVGTGQHPYFVTPPGSRSGLNYWGPRLLEVMGAAQSQGVGFQAKYLLGDDRYTRVDFAIQDRSWRLDAAEVVDRLVHLGREAAIAQMEGLAPRFFQRDAPTYTAFASSRPPPAAGAAGAACT